MTITNRNAGYAGRKLGEAKFDFGNFPFGVNSSWSGYKTTLNLVATIIPDEEQEQEGRRSFWPNPANPPSETEANISRLTSEVR